MRTRPSALNSDSECRSWTLYHLVHGAPVSAAEGFDDSVAPPGGGGALAAGAGSGAAPAKSAKSASRPFVSYSIATLATERGGEQRPDSCRSPIKGKGTRDTYGARFLRGERVATHQNLASPQAAPGAWRHRRGCSSRCRPWQQRSGQLDEGRGEERRRRRKRRKKGGGGDGEVKETSIEGWRKLEIWASSTEPWCVEELAVGGPYRPSLTAHCCKDTEYFASTGP